MSLIGRSIATKRALGAASLFVLGSLSSVQAATVRPASAAEFGKLLIGCWREDIRQTSTATFEESEACFHRNGKVDASWFLGSTRPPAEGLEDTTWYRLSGNRLVLGGVAGWIQAQRLACDAVVVPGRHLRLRNCVDESGRSASESDHDFTFLPGQTELRQ